MPPGEAALRFPTPHVAASSEGPSPHEGEAGARAPAGSPRGAGGRVAAERRLESAGKPPQQVVDWLGGQPPASAPGAVALASAYRSLGRQAEAADLIKTW